MDVAPRKTREIRPGNINGEPLRDSGDSKPTAPYYGLKSPEADRILAQVRQVVATWGEVARRLQLPREETQRMAAAFSVRRSR